MTSKAKSFITTTAALAVIVVIIAGAGWLVVKVIEQGSTTMTAIVAAAATVGVGLVGRYYEREKAAQATRKSELGTVYEQIASVTHDVKTPRQMEKLVLGFFRKGIVYAGPSVLEAYRVWRDQIHDDDTTSQAELRASMLRFERLLLAMRSDLGMSNKGLKEGDLLRVVLNDYDTTFDDAGPDQIAASPRSTN